jgi:hypothetical protein
VAEAIRPWQKLEAPSDNAEVLVPNRNRAVAYRRNLQSAGRHERRARRAMTGIARLFGEEGQPASRAGA